MTARGKGCRQSGGEERRSRSRRERACGECGWEEDSFRGGSQSGTGGPTWASLGLEASIEAGGVLGFGAVASEKTRPRRSSRLLPSITGLGRRRPAAARVCACWGCRNPAIPQAACVLDEGGGLTPTSGAGRMLWSSGAGSLRFSGSFFFCWRINRRSVS